MTVVNPSWLTASAPPKPGQFFVHYLSRAMFYGFCVEPENPTSPASWIVLKDGAGRGPEGRHLNRLDTGGPSLILTDVEITFSEQDLAYGPPDSTPAGALILTPKGQALCARRDWHTYAVSLSNGAIMAIDLQQSYWVPRWQLIRRRESDAPVVVIEFTGAPVEEA